MSQVVIQGFDGSEQFAVVLVCQLRRRPALAMVQIVVRAEVVGCRLEEAAQVLLLQTRQHLQEQKLPRGSLVHVPLVFQQPFLLARTRQFGLSVWRVADVLRRVQQRLSQKTYETLQLLWRQSLLIRR